MPTASNIPTDAHLEELRVILFGHADPINHHVSEYDWALRCSHRVIWPVTSDDALVNLRTIKRDAVIRDRLNAAKHLPCGV